MTAKNLVLIVTGEKDIQADQMVAELRGRGQDVIRLHPERLAIDSTISIDLDDERQRFGISAYGRHFDAAAVKSAWYRKPMPVEFPAGMPEAERSFAAQEFDQMFRSFLLHLDCYWISPPEHMRIASLKPLQLAASRKVGLSIPKTFISNDPVDLHEFISTSTDEIVFKTLSTPIIRDDAACLTTMLKKDDLQSLSQIRMSGGIFQGYVEKQIELRVIVIGDEVIAFEIHSQDFEESMVDWRGVPPLQMKHAVHVLPEEIELRIREFVQAFGLEFSAMDLILTPEGRYVFLENNPGGQFGWLEHCTGVPLNAKIADKLISGGENRKPKRFW